MGGSKDRVASIRGSQPPSMGLSNSLTFAVLANRRLKNLIHLRFKESQPLKTPARSTIPLSRVQVRSSAWPVHGAIWSTCCHVFRCTLVETKIVIFRQVAAAAYICISHKCTHFDASWHYSGIEEREREGAAGQSATRIGSRGGADFEIRDKCELSGAAFDFYATWHALELSALFSMKSSKRYLLFF